MDGDVLLSFVTLGVVFVSLDDPVFEGVVLGATDGGSFAGAGRATWFSSSPPPEVRNRINKTKTNPTPKVPPPAIRPILRFEFLAPGFCGAIGAAGCI